MSPERATVIIIDDNREFAEVLGQILAVDGHQVKAIAGSKKEGLELIDKLEREKEKIDVALLDGNLTKGSTGGLDGKELANEIRSRLPKVRIISISTSPQAWSDRPDLTCLDGSASISKAVTEL